MKNLIIILLVVAAGWFAYKNFSSKSKPNDVITQYGDNLKQSEDKAKDAAIIANQAVLQGAVNSFKSSNGKFPDKLEELVEKGFMGRIPSGDYTYDSSNGVVGIK